MILRPLFASLIAVAGCAPAAPPPAHDAPAPSSGAVASPAPPGSASEVAKVDAAPGEPPRESKSALPTECGDLAIARARMLGSGMGSNHPDVRAVEAGLAKCPDKSPSFEACARARQERESLVSAGHGLTHPDVRGLDDALALCTDVRPSNGPKPAEDPCGSLRRQRAELIAGGKGENHPSVLAIDAQLMSCAGSTYLKQP